MLAPSKSTADRHAAGLARALAFIDAHLAGPLDAPRLAREAAMSTHHFHRIFSARFGVSVGDYVATRRLQRACALLVSGREPVLEVALAVGYESAQALAKAMRRELDATPTEVRGGETRAWARPLATPSPHPCTPETGGPMIQPTRIATLRDGHVALTATACGMVDRTLSRAASAAFGELYRAVAVAGVLGRARTWLAFSPDDPQGPDDPACRYVAGVLFDQALEAAPAATARPAIALQGSLEWWPIAPGAAAVFLHRGPYDTLYQTWQAIYRDWLPASGPEPRDAPPFEVMLNDARTTPAAELLTEIWIPVFGP